MQTTLQYAGHIATCRRPTSGSAWDQWRVVSLSCTFQRAVLAALRGTDGGSCHISVYISSFRNNGSAWNSRRVVLLSLYGTSGSVVQVFAYVRFFY